MEDQKNSLIKVVDSHRNQKGLLESPKAFYDKRQQEGRNQASKTMSRIQIHVHPVLDLLTEAVQSLASSLQAIIRFQVNQSLNSK